MNKIKIVAGLGVVGAVMCLVSGCETGAAEGRGTFARMWRSWKNTPRLKINIKKVIMLLGVLSSMAFAERLPNFIIVFTDDQGYQDLGCFGSPNIKTPRIDQMAKEGMRFTNFYAQTVCGPSRGALMTGCYPLRLARQADPDSIHPELHTNEITIAEVLKEQGYATAAFGKWDLAGHNNSMYKTELLPPHQGFDTFFGTPGSNDRSADLIRSTKIVEKNVDMSTLTKRYTDEAIAFIQQKKDVPFFVYLAHSMPHVTLAASADFKGKSAGGLYGDVIEEIDFNVGRLLDKVKELGLDSSTYIIYASDNGPWLNKKPHAGNAHPLRSGKTSCWEGGLRVPCVMRAPGKIPAGAQCNAVAATIDMMPTLTKLAGGAPPSDRAIDGVDISALMFGKAETLDRNYFFYQHDCLRAVRSGQWKLMLPHTEPIQGSIATKWRAHVAKDDAPRIQKALLFDLQADIGETADVATQHPEKVAELMKLAAWAQSDIGDHDRFGANARTFGGQRRTLMMALADVTRLKLGEFGERGSEQRPTGTLFPEVPILSNHLQDWNSLSDEKKGRAKTEFKGTLFGLASGDLTGTDDRVAYADALKAHPGLRAHWKFDGNLEDRTGKASARSSGTVSYAEGVLGKALKVNLKSPVSVPNADLLRGKSGSRATLEMFFQIASAPTGDKDVVLIAQADGEQARYIVGIKNDLSALVYRNEKAAVLTRIELPTAQPIEIGRWYHLAITSYDLDLRAYIDGYECALTGGAFEFTRAGPKKSTLTFGTTSVSGWGTAEILLDEVACYAEGLTQAQIQEHVKAAGWTQRLRETGEIVAKVAAVRAAERERKQAALLSAPALMAPGKSRIYEGKYLEAIAFTVGGIGSGAIQFNGHAEPAIWQIAKNFTNERIDNSFLAVRAQVIGGQPVVRALQTVAVGPFEAMSSLKFEGEYPFAKYRFEEPALPVLVELEVFNPLIPMDLKNSAIPCAIATVKVTNPTATPVKVDILAAQRNALGYAEGRGGGYGQNVNAVVRRGDATMLHMTRQGSAGSDMVLMTRAKGATGVATWKSSPLLYGAFTQNGACRGPEKSELSAAGQTVDGALSAPLELAAGETKSVTFALTWYFEGGKHGEGRSRRALEGEGKGGPWSHSGNQYTTWWTSAMGVAEYLRDNLDDLTTRTRLYHDTLYASNLPVWLLDRLSSPLAVLRSQTCWWSADGYFGAWEGSRSNMGSCGGNCTHVWQYAQGHARLFPELGRLMREEDFAQQKPSGLFPNRHGGGEAAADGFFGTILNTYREHLCSLDDTWVKEKWPGVKRAMVFGMEQWDPNRDGFLQNLQHNTLDGKMMGCSSWIGSLYLSALEAAARIADIAGEPKQAAEYRSIRASGQEMQNERLWNGEYYIQEVGEARVQDYLDGCHIDQLLGEWWAGQLGIGLNYPQERSRQAMESLLKYNFLADFHGQSLKPRQFVTSDDAGLKMITWPKAPQPIPGMKYGDELMSGFEYSAAATMIQNKMLREGLMVLKAVADRYDGRLRTEGITPLDVAAWGYTGNPFGDDECGKFYGRSLSTWSALIALQGFIYDGPAGRIGFRPVWQPENHRSFFTAAEGYGLFTQSQSGRGLTASIALRSGQLRLAEVVLAVPDGKRPKSVQAKLLGELIESRFDGQGGDVKLSFKSPLLLKAGEQLEIKMESE